MEKLMYYTLYDRESILPRAVICIGEKEHTLAYGISLCSGKDNYRLGVGRKIARSRCLDAINGTGMYNAMQNDIRSDKGHFAIWRLDFEDYVTLQRLFEMGKTGIALKCNVVEDFSFEDMMVYLFSTINE